MKFDNFSYKAVLYARKSTESEDKQVQSIDDQIRIMKQVAKTEGLRIIDIIYEAKSAKAPGKRPVFKQMMRDIEDGKYNVILAWDTSRLSRNPKDGGDLQWLLSEGSLRGIRTHEKWYHDDDDLLFSIENSMNGRYIKELSVKVTRGMSSKADKGDYPGSAPVGYLNDRINRKILKDPVMFDRVAKLWQYALTGTYSVSELTRIAKKLGIKTPQHKRRGGNDLSYNCVLKLLQSPFYAGKLKWGKKIYNGNHPAMVSDAEFKKMQNILHPNKHASRPKTNPLDFILRGLLTCSECGYAIVTEKKYKKLSDGTTKEYRYCHCCGKNRKQKCKYKKIYVREEELLSQIKNELSKYTIDEDFYKLAIEALIEEDELEVSQQNLKISEINASIAKKKTELDGLRRALYTGLITDQGYFIIEQENLEKELARLEEERNKVADIAKDWKEIANDVFLFARYAKEDFDSDDWERKRAVIKRLGANLKLSGRTIEFTPVKYLVPIAENRDSLEAKKEAARTAPQQIKKDLKEDLIEKWWSTGDSNSSPLPCHGSALPNELVPRNM